MAEIAERVEDNPKTPFQKSRWPLGPLGLALAWVPVLHALAGEVFSEFAFRPHPGARLPLASEFVDNQGSVVPLGRFFVGKPVVLVLDYLRCKTLCGLTLENLAAGLGALPLDAGRDFNVVLISIDPRDKPANVAAAKAKISRRLPSPGGG